MLLQIAGISKSTFFYEKKHINDKRLKDEPILKEIRDIFEHSNGKYGYPRITIELQNRGYNINEIGVITMQIKASQKSSSLRSCGKCEAFDLLHTACAETKGNCYVSYRFVRKFLDLKEKVYNYHMSNRNRRKYRINRQGQMLIAGIFIVIAVIIVIIAANNAANKEPDGSDLDNSSAVSDLSDNSDASDPSDSSDNAVWTSVATAAAPSYLDGLKSDIFSDICSKQAVLIHAGSGKVIASKDGDTKGFPASITKMMTAIIAIENISDLNSTYTMPVEIYDKLYNLDLSTAGFAKNDTVTVKDLLYGLLMRSGAECCLAMENIVAGGSDAFVAMMNKKAAEIGMYNTHFMNSTGEHDPQHYSTPHDMAILLDYALKNPVFKEIISTSIYKTAPIASNGDGLQFQSTLYLATPDMSVYADKFVLKGGKTGYTSSAGQCLATYAVINGEEYILVTFGAFGYEGATTSHLHAKDHIDIYSSFALALSDV